MRIRSISMVEFKVKTYMNRKHFSCFLMAQPHRGPDSLSSWQHKSLIVFNFEKFTHRGKSYICEISNKIK